MKGWKKSLLRYGITVAVAAVILVLVFVAEGLFTQQKSSQEVFKTLCDGFFVSGILLALFGILLRISGMGGFDGVSYCVYVVFVRFIPSKGKHIKNYTDYKTAKMAKRGGKSSVAYLYIVGGALLALSVLFLILYYNAA
jgi:hypothetical protein